MEKPSRCNRSENMRRISSKNTRPEQIVRQLLRRLGFPGYRLYRKDLPGTPDICYVGRKKIIFIHGCFWHRHNCKRGQYFPKTNSLYWKEKFKKNVSRDFASISSLSIKGWKTLIIWECEFKDEINLKNKLLNFLLS